MNARYTAFQALQKLKGKDGYSNIVLDAVLKNSGLSHVDRGFAAALFYGVLERGITLDAVIRRYLRPSIKLSQPVRLILQLGLYQLLYMDKIPDNAAVDESVKLVRKIGQLKAAGLVNAILRQFIRDQKQIPLPKSGCQRLSVEYACPEWMIESFTKDYGYDNCVGILQGFLQHRYLAVRANTNQISAADLLMLFTKQGIQVRRSTICPDALILESAGDVRQLPGYAQGLFHVQDLAAQLCVQALNIAGTMRVLDVCAAPGGKSFTIAQQLQSGGEVLALDLYPQKVELILQGAKRLRLENIRARVQDARVYNPALGRFDRVLCDLPCSGLGILAKKPEIRYKNVAFLDNLPELQYHLLYVSACYLRVGGILLYSTCTLRDAENAQICNRFLQSHPEFAPYSIFPNMRRAIQEPAHMLTLLPQMYQTDGFFISAFQKIKEPVCET